MRSRHSFKLSKDHPLIKQQLQELEEQYQSQKLQIIKNAHKKLLDSRETDSLRYFGFTAYEDRSRRNRV